MGHDPSDSSRNQKGPNFAKNARPESSKRVTFALGSKGQEQADRLARILSNYRKGGVSQSALVRALLQIAESAALQSGDPVAKLVFGETQSIEGQIEKSTSSEKLSKQLWKRIRDECSDA
jgi:hypothetical protein